MAILVPLCPLFIYRLIDVIEINLFTLLTVTVSYKNQAKPFHSCVTAHLAV